MSIIPVNLARVSQNLRSMNLLNTVSARQLDLYKVQSQLSSGLRFQLPSDDPGGASAVMEVDRQLDRLGLVDKNLQKVNATITAAESAMDTAIDLMQEAQQITLQGVNDTIDAGERDSLAKVIDAITDQLITVGNQQYLDTYLFSGHAVGEEPFARDLHGIVYRGDGGRRETIIDTDFSQDHFTISGLEFFGAVSTPVPGTVDLNPDLTPQTRVADLRLPNGNPLSLEHIVVSDGLSQATIDLSKAATVGDVLDRLNAEMPAGLNAAINGNRLEIAGAPNITVSEAGGGRTAFDLGLLTAGAVPVVTGNDLDPVVTPRTPLAVLNGGAGLNLAGGIRIHNGVETAVVDFTGATTVEDVLNRINATDIGAFAELSADGKHLNIHTRVSGTQLRVEENGGSAATNLGIRTVSTATLLTSLNAGAGVHTSVGADVRLAAADGSFHDLDFDNAKTLQDVLDLLNGTGVVTAGFDTNSNGLRIQDTTGGGGALTLTALDGSSVLQELGLAVPPTAPDEIIGTDVSPVQPEGAFTALLEIKRGLEDNDTARLSAAGQMLENVLTFMGQVRGEMAARAKSMHDRSLRVEDAQYAAQILKSDTQDVDITDAVVRYQQIQTALQANLQTSSRVMNLSLLDYLR